MSRPSPRPHQREALSAVQAAVGQEGRAQLVMCCGSGKTLVGRWLAERIQARRTLVLVPSLALIAQTLAQWRAAGGWAFEALILCSDPSTAVGHRERDGSDGADITAPFWARHRATVTTSAAVAAARVRQVRADRPMVVFCTYHSAPVAAAAAHACPEGGFDLLIADEAHHLAGQPRAEFRVVLDDRGLPAARRVFMTATQVVPTGAAAAAGSAGGLLSMADEGLFGPTVYRLGFAEAIAANLLCDYEVVVYETAGGQSPDPAAALAVAAQRGLTRVLSFHGRVAKARRFAAAVDGMVLPDGRRVVAQVVAGADPAMRRADALELLADPRPGTMVVVASARCLAEGVDVPAVDGVLFADPKNSDVDVVQAVGRALRPAPGKTRGQVLIPVVCPPQLDEDTSLSTSRFAAVWRILRGLRAVDARLAEDLRTLSRDASRRGHADGSRRVVWQLPGTPDTTGLWARLVEADTPAWDGFFAELVSYVAEHGTARPPGGHRLHAWCHRQRVAYRRGMLLDQRAAALRSLPGWTWDLAEQQWLEQCAVVAAASAPGGLDLGDPAVAARTIPYRRGRVSTIGRWCAAQRIAARRGELTDLQRDLLDRIAGWRWQALDPADVACLDLLAEHVAWRGDANLPADYVDDDLPVGRWLERVRRLRAGGTLPAALLDEIEVSTPSRGTDGALRWHRGEHQWRLGLEALHAFHARQGHARVPASHREVLADGITVTLGTWCTRQRFEYRHEQMPADRAAALAALPGWCWEIQPTPRIGLDIGDSRHGTRTGYTKGCRCTACTHANRADARARAARAAAGEPTSDWVSAHRARGHLRVLIGQGATVKGLARAGDLNPKTVADLVAGRRGRIRPDTERAVLSMNLQRALTGAAPGTVIPAGPTWQLITDLTARGWPKRWIAAELGMGISLQLHPERITAGNAAKVAALHARLDGLSAPPRRRGQPTPPLRELLTDLPRPA